MFDQLESLIGSYTIADLKKACQRVSRNYRSLTSFTFEKNIDYIAYILYRLPATYAVGLEVLKRLQQQLPHFVPQTVFDIGSGPGSMILAFETLFPSVRSVLAIEKEPRFIELAKKLITIQTEWIEKDVLDVPTLQISCDMAVMSYCLGEMNTARRDHCIKLVADVSCIVVIEPGTPVGYQTVMQARDALIDQGFHVIAPCPHSVKCPIQAPDWCHFSCRLPRTRMHKLIKDAALGYEDEKFSYVIASKSGKSCRERIVREPLHRSGHSRFVLCSQTGMLHEEVISRKNPEYQVAKKAGWGDSI